MLKPVVSISCITYNHGPYIRQALESFLMQREVPFEVLIHDDCSDDDTVPVLREYEEKYPGVIKVLYERENQYSRGISNISGVFNFPRANGRYIAMCEGDDFWNDPYKLKKQADYLDAHPECALVCHSSHILNMDDAWHSRDLIRPYTGHRQLSPEEVISKPVNFPMASLMFPSQLAKQLPQWYFDCPVGDIPLQLFMLENGSVFYMDEPMSTYRSGRSGSWSDAMDQQGNSSDEKGVDPAGAAARERDKEKWTSHHEAMKRLYEAFDEETGGIYHGALEDALRRSKFQIDLKEGKLDCVRQPENRKYLEEMEPTERRLMQLKAASPKVYELLQKTYRKMKRG